MSSEYGGGRFLHDVGAGIASTFLTAWLIFLWGPEVTRRSHDQAYPVQFPPKELPGPAETEPIPSPSPRPKPQTSTIKDENGRMMAEVYPRECSVQGRSGEFDAVVFSSAYNWEIGKTDRVQLNNRSVDLVRVLRSESFQRVMEGAKEIVAVGAASCEATRLGGAWFEERRAMQRATQLVAWIEEANPLGRVVSIYPVIPLNLGRFEGPCTSSSAELTAKQRRIILIAVRARSEELDLRDCLKQELYDHPQLRQFFDGYSKFELGGDMGTDLPDSLR